MTDLFQTHNKHNVITALNESTFSRTVDRDPSEAQWNPCCEEKLWEVLFAEWEIHIDYIFICLKCRLLFHCTCLNSYLESYQRNDFSKIQKHQCLKIKKSVRTVDEFGFFFLSKSLYFILFYFFDA